MPLRTQIYDVLPGRPFGRARHGTNVTISSDPHTRRTGTGTSGANTLTLNSAGFNDGDLIKIVQMRGVASATEENHEVALIVSGGGTTTLTLQDNLGRSYTNAQVIDIREYRNANLAFTVTAWNGLTGALWAIADMGTTTGSVNGQGLNGYPSTSDNNGQGGSLSNWRGSRSGGGFQGGWNSADGNTSGSGEGFGSGWGTTSGSLPEIKNTGDSGGGGVGGGNGAGGGNGTAGENGGDDTNGIGGIVCGNAALTSAFPGGGGGGGNSPGQDGPASGGNGGTMGFAWSKFWNQVTVDQDGGDGGDTTNPPYGGGGVADGGGGAGGSLQVNCERGALGSSLITAAGGNSQYTSGNGGVGRNRINYGTSNPSGSTTPAASTALDPKLRDLTGGAHFFL